MFLNTLDTTPPSSQSNSKNSLPAAVSTINKTKRPGKISKNFKIFYINEVGRFRMLRQNFKQRVENCDKDTLLNMKEQYNGQIKTNNAKVLLDFNINLLQKIKSQRNDTETVIHETLNRCKSLWQQLGQPVKQVEELRQIEESMVKCLKDLQK